MTQFDILLIMSIFLVSPLSFIAGYLACYILKKDNAPMYIYGNEKYIGTWHEKDYKQPPVNQASDEEQVNPDAAKFSKKDDVINHAGVGIVYRPTGEELDKMNETQAVREAKEEMAKTFESVPPPQI